MYQRKDVGNIVLKCIPQKITIFAKYLTHDSEMKKFYGVLLTVSALLLLFNGCRMNGHRSIKDKERVTETSTGLPSDIDSKNDDRPYSWMNDEEFDQYCKLKEDISWQDSLARVLSSRLNKSVRMDDFLKLTFTDGEKLYYWNEYWGDLTEVPSGFDVTDQVNWFWKIPNGACFTGIVNGTDSVTVYISAGHQVAYVDDGEFKESYLEGVMDYRPLEDLKHTFKRGTVKGKDGQELSYLFCTFEGNNAKTGKGEYHKIVRSLPVSDGTFEITVEYPLPKTAEVQKIITTLSSYPNISDISHYGVEIR